MSEMVERVAMAIERELGYRGDDHVRAARAAIEAMREPSPEMVEAGTLGASGSGVSRETIAAWQAMISAALSPEEEGIGR